MKAQVKHTVSSTLSSKHHKITFCRSVSLCFSPWPVEFELDRDPLRGISHGLMSIPPSAAWADWRKKNFQKESSRVMLLNHVKSWNHVPNEVSETLSVQLVSPNGPAAQRPNNLPHRVAKLCKETCVCAHRFGVGIFTWGGNGRGVNEPFKLKCKNL